MILSLESQGTFDLDSGCESFHKDSQARDFHAIWQITHAILCSL